MKRLLWGALLLVAHATAAAAADCLNYRAFLQRLDAEDTQGRSRSLATYGDYVYVCGETSGFSVVDASDPTRMRNVWTAVTQGSTVHMDIEGSHAYVAEFGYGLEIFDLTNPALPTPVGELATGNAFDVAVAGGYAYVTHTDANDLLVIDVSNPAAPSVVGSFDSAGQTLAIEIRGGFAYLTEDITENFSVLDRLAILDLSTPTAPLLEGEVRTENEGLDLVLEGNRAYVVTSSASVEIVDVSAPDLPTNFEVTVPNVVSLALDGSRGYTVRNDRMRVLDLTDPFAVVELGSLRLANPRQILRRGNVAFVADDAVGLTSVLLNGVDRAYPLGSNDQSGVWVAVEGEGGRSFAMDFPLGVRRIDTTDPTQPVYGELFGQPALRMSLVGTRLYVPFGSLAIYDVSNPDVPSELGSVTSPTTLLGIAVNEPFAYVTTETGIRVVDVSNPQQPQLRGTASCGAGTLDVLVWNDRVIVLRGEDGLDYYDVSNPDAPACLTNYPLSLGSFDDAVVLDDLLYVSSDAAGLVRLTLGANDVQRNGGLELSPVPVRLTTDGSFLYATATNGITHVVDVRNGEFTKVAEWTGVFGRDMSFDGEHVLMIGDAGLEIFSPQCSSIVPVAVSAFEAELHERGVLLRWRAVGEMLRFHLHRRSGSREVRITTVPVTDSFVDATASSGGSYEYDLAYVDADGGETRVATAQVTVPAPTLRLGPLAPNPSAGVTAVHFALPRAAAVTLRVHDVAGRRVRDLSLATLAAGPHVATWNGRDEEGRPVARGAYFVTLTTNRQTVTRKLVLVR